jgi:hypothetical protein
MCSPVVVAGIVDVVDTAVVVVVSINCVDSNTLTARIRTIFDISPIFAELKQEKGCDNQRMRLREEKLMRARVPTPIVWLLYYCTV